MFEELDTDDSGDVSIAELRTVRTDPNTDTNPNINPNQVVSST